MTDIPYLTTEQMREVDRAMIEDYGITLLQMMENAGRCFSVPRELYAGPGLALDVGPIFAGDDVITVDW